jgi:hypothetical protein
LIPQGAATLNSNVPAAPSLSILTTVRGGSEVREEIVLLQGSSRSSSNRLPSLTVRTS